MSNLYRTSLDYGGWFSFNSTREKWNPEYAEKMLNHFFSMPLFRQMFKKYEISDELLITTNMNYSNIFGKSVLVIGAGPSSEKVDEYVLKSYDHFYKNDFLFNHKIDVALLGDEVDLQDARLQEYIERYSPVIGFEHSSRRDTYELLHFKRNHQKVFVYLTRYFSRLGYVTRAMVLAKLFGANRIDFVGLDGFKNQSHYFENNKSAPPFNNVEKFQEQMRIFCRYMFEDLGCENINNLGEHYQDSIYSGILEEFR